MGRLSFRGYYPLAVLAEERYRKHLEEYPEECRAVLAQFTDYALMAYLYAKPGDDRDRVKALLDKHKYDILNSERIGRYKKWLLHEVLSGGKMLKAAAAVHKTKGKLGLQKRSMTHD